MLKSSKAIETELTEIQQLTGWRSKAKATINDWLVIDTETYNSWTDMSTEKNYWSQ